MEFLMIEIILKLQPLHNGEVKLIQLCLKTMTHGYINSPRITWEISHNGISIQTSTGILNPRKSITIKNIIKRQMLLKEEWMRKYMDSLRNIQIHLMNGRGASCRS